MAVKKKFALGRGLDALISTEEVRTEGSSTINEIDMTAYNRISSHGKKNRHRQLL